MYWHARSLAYNLRAGYQIFPCLHGRHPKLSLLVDFALGDRRYPDHL